MQNKNIIDITGTKIIEELTSNITTQKYYDDLTYTFIWSSLKPNCGELVVRRVTKNIQTPGTQTELLL